MFRHVTDLPCYFAYGSNMSRARLHERVPGAVAQGAARLDGWRLRFDKPSRDGSTKANVGPEEGSVVWGVVWALPAGGWSVLDGYEPGYDRIPCEISAASGRILTAGLYVYRGPTGDGLPFDWYLAHLIDGGREHALPADYLEDLRAIAMRIDARGRGAGRAR